MSRDAVVRAIARRISAVAVDHPIRVGIDGCDTAGKTTLADELVAPLAELGRPTIRASLDGFHNPSSVRHQRGRDSPEGYFFDSFNTDAVIESLLRPLGPAGSAHYRRAVFDFRTDQPVTVSTEIASPNAVLLFDGVFLHRRELVSFWDFSIFLHVEFETVLRRAEARDAGMFGSIAEVRARYERRYIPGQRLYFAMCSPSRCATAVIHNTDPAQPRVVWAA
jgi:uridine kinase